MKLGEIIKEYRKTHDLSMQEFSKLSGIRLPSPPPIKKPVSTVFIGAHRFFFFAKLGLIPTLLPTFSEFTPAEQAAILHRKRAAFVCQCRWFPALKNK